MQHEIDKNMHFETNLLNAGSHTKFIATNPESLPIHLTTAHNVEDLDDLEHRYEVGGFCYNRSKNPNRTALIELMSYLEGGEDAIICASGMSAISTPMITLIQKGDHILSDKTLYNETLEISTLILSKFGVETTFIDFTDLEEVKKSVRPNTKLFYCETVTNPIMTVPDLKAIADIAHENKAIFMVDNTFMTGALVKPIELGADLVACSLTKFANGHSDAVCGALVGKKDLIAKSLVIQKIIGTQVDPFTSWLSCRGIRTLDLRIKKQCSNAFALAHALEKSPYVKDVYYPGLESSPSYAVAKKEFGEYFGGMLSIELPEDRKKLNAFIRNLKLVR